MKNIETLPNIGKNLADKLREVGVDSAESLQKLGSKEAFLRVKQVDDGACINMLYALEGAIQGICWHGLAKEAKADLLKFFKEV